MPPIIWDVVWGLGDLLPRNGSVKVAFRFNKLVEWLRGNLLFNLCIDHVNMWFSKCCFAAAEPSVKLHFKTCLGRIVYLKWEFARICGKRVTFWNAAFETILERSVKSLCTFWGHSFKSESVYGAYILRHEFYHKDIKTSSKRLYAYPGLMPFPHSGEWKEVRQLLFGSSITVTDCHKFGGLKQHTFILSQFWRPEIWNQGWQGHTPSRGSWGEPIWCLFPASGSCHQPLAFLCL